MSEFFVYDLIAVVKTFLPGKFFIELFKIIFVFYYHEITERMDKVIVPARPYKQFIVSMPLF